MVSGCVRRFLIVLGSIFAGTIKSKKSIIVILFEENISYYDQFNAKDFLPILKRTVTATEWNDWYSKHWQPWVSKMQKSKRERPSSTATTNAISSKKKKVEEVEDSE
jgi:hypothetical protein